MSMLSDRMIESIARYEYDNVYSDRVRHDPVTNETTFIDTQYDAGSQSYVIPDVTVQFDPFIEGGGVSQVFDREKYNAEVNRLQQDVRKSRARIFLDPDTYFNCNLAGVPPYFVTDYIPDSRGWLINYFASDVPFKRTAVISWDNIDKYKLGNLPYRETNLMFAIKGQRCYRSNFEALQKMVGVQTLTEFSWKNMVPTIGAIASSVAPLLTLLPGAGAILSPLIGGLGNAMQGNRNYYRQPNVYVRQQG